MGKKSSSSSGKVRFDGLDVAAMVAQLRRSLLGRRVINIYDGDNDSSFLFKLDGTVKTMLFVESGVRFHITTTMHSSSSSSSTHHHNMPSPFCSKLRKHLRGLRLESMAQLGKYDRVVLLVFGSGGQRHALLLELYARGNVILTNAAFEILALLRSHEYHQQEVQVQVGRVYPVTYATSVGSSEKEKGQKEEEAGKKGLLGAKTAQEAVDWAKEVLAPTITSSSSNDQSTTEKQQKKSNESPVPLKALLLRPSSGVHHFGPSLLEHCIRKANIDPNLKLTASTVEETLEPADWERLLSSLDKEGTGIMTLLSTQPEGKGYILYRPRTTPSSNSSNDNDHPTQSAARLLPHDDKVLEEFQPHLLQQHEGRPTLTYDSFAEAVDEFFAHLGGQKRALRAEAAEAAARERLEKIRQDQRRRVEALEKDQERLKEHARLVEAHADQVDKALGVINSALDSGMDWEALEQLVETEQANQNPIALLIKRLDLEKDRMVLSLPDVFANDYDDQTVDVTVSLNESAFGNASDMFAKYRASKAKSEKTLEASTKALKAAEATAQRQLAEAQKRSKLSSASVLPKRKPHWFEKFHWMITSDNYLVLGGRDAQQNELLVKRYLRPGDAYLHADVHGAASCILRAKRRRVVKGGGGTEPVPLAEQALREAGNFTICRSSAWASRMVTSAWWVESHQVSKTAPSGEYLTVGSFMVRGKKNFLPPSQLEMGLAILFRLGDEDSIARHRNERRDFSLLDMDEEYDDDVNDVVEPSETAAVSESMQTGGETEEVEQIERKVEDPVADGEGNDGPTTEDQTIDVPKSDDAASSDNDEAEDSEAKAEPADDTSKSEPSSEAIGAERNVSGDLSTEKKGLSKRDRKLIKKYGSLEAAETAIAEREELERVSKKAEKKKVSSTGNADEASQSNAKRGKRSKLKRVAKKYGDQDDEERELALLALHAGEDKSKKNNGKRRNIALSEREKEAAEETAALLLKDSEKVAKELPASVWSILSDCVAIQAPESDEADIRWDKFDADVLEQLLALKSEEQQIAAAKRLLFLKQSTRVDNFSASLAGIIRTIRKYGHENLEVEVDGASENAGGVKRKTKAEKAADQEKWRETLAEEGILDDDLEDDAIDDTVEISKLTGKPHPDDLILYAIPVCAPYQSLAKFQYRVKLTPGNLKRGKAAKQCVEMFLKGEAAKSPETERYRELIRHIGDNEFVQTICSDVKIAAPGASKVAKKQKSSGKRSGKKKK